MTKELVGSELLEFIRLNPEMPRNELAIETGYFRTVAGKDGAPATKRPKLEALLDAIATAKGVELAPSSGNAIRCTGILKTTKIGSVPISRHYLAQIGVKPNGKVKVSRADEGPYLLIEAA